MYLPMNAKVPASGMQDRSALMFRQGMQALAEKKWVEAETIFGEIDTHKPSYKFNGRSAKYMLWVLNHERFAHEALDAGDIKTALKSFHKTENLEKITELENLLVISDYESRAAQHEEEKRYRQAAWIYDQLAKRFPEHPQKAMWEASYSENWHRELSPIFDRGLELFEKSNWVEAKEAFTEVSCADPNFRRHGKMAAALLDQCKREIRKIANNAMSQGHLEDALTGYQEIMDMHKIAQIEEILDLQTKGEAIAIIS